MDEDEQTHLELGQDSAIIISTSRFINAFDLTAIPKIKVERATIKYSTHIKYLGITIMNNLSWEKQVTNMTHKIRSVLYQLKLSKHLLPDALRTKLVVSLIFLHIDYC